MGNWLRSKPVEVRALLALYNKFRAEYNMEMPEFNPAHISGDCYRVVYTVSRQAGNARKCLEVLLLSFSISGDNTHVVFVKNVSYPERGNNPIITIYNTCLNMFDGIYIGNIQLTIDSMTNAITLHVNDKKTTYTDETIFDAIKLITQ